MIFILSCISICKSQLRLCQLWCFVTQLNEDSDDENCYAKYDGDEQVCRWLRQ